MDSKNKIRLLQLRKHMTNFGFISHYEGPILTKGGRKSKRLSEKIKSDFQKDTNKFNWKAPPKARIAISFNGYVQSLNYFSSGVSNSS